VASQGVRTVDGRREVIPDHTPPVSLPTSYLSVDETRQPAILTIDGKDSDFPLLGL